MLFQFRITEHNKWMSQKGSLYRVWSQIPPDFWQNSAHTTQPGPMSSSLQTKQIIAHGTIPYRRPWTPVSSGAQTHIRHPMAGLYCARYTHVLQVLGKLGSTAGLSQTPSMFCVQMCETVNKYFQSSWQLLKWE